MLVGAERAAGESTIAARLLCLGIPIGWMSFAVSVLSRLFLLRLVCFLVCWLLFVSIGFDWWGRGGFCGL